MVRPVNQTEEEAMTAAISHKLQMVRKILIFLTDLVRLSFGNGSPNKYV